METVVKWLFELLMFAPGMAQPVVSVVVNRFYSPPNPPPPPLPLQLQKSWSCPRTLKTAPKGKRFA